MAELHAPRPPQPRDAGYRERVAQWGEQQILKDYTLQIDHARRSGLWRGASPLAVTYEQATLIYEALHDEYPDAFDIVDPTDQPDENVPSSESPRPLNGVAAPTHRRRHDTEDDRTSAGSSPAEPPTPAPTANTSYSKTVHYENDPVQISREVVLTDNDWDGPHRPSLHVHGDGALLKMSGHPITEFDSPRALRTMAALFAKAARELERDDWD